MVGKSIVVGSGKGGVGKSTVSVNLALALADRGHAVGLLDADFHGPSVARMLGLGRREWTRRWDVAARGKIRQVEPLERYGIKVMSFGFVLGDDQPMGLEAIGLGSIVRQLAQNVVWGDIDFLVVDLPPGTGDVHHALLASMSVAGAIVVVTPQDVAHLDGRKAVQAYGSSGIPVLGAVENMSAMVCPHCGERVEVFPAVAEDRSIWAMGVEKLASVAMDPSVGASGDHGVPVVRAVPALPAAEAFRGLAETIAARLA
jgi:ATP-binding protein involved in chromosome partitioning